MWSSTRATIITAATAVFAVYAPSTAVTVSDTKDEGMDAWKITTSNATYYLQKAAGAFSSIVDKSGADWINFHTSPDGQPSAAAGKYRGIPNLVHPGDVFHPGYALCKSTMTQFAGKVTVTSTSSAEGGWELRYDFFDDRAQITVVKKSRAYWFLYEGTPGGNETPSGSWYMTSNITTKTSSSKTKEGDIPNKEWICFGANSGSRVLYLAHHQDDASVDKYYWMASGIDQKGMTVFGFGRNGLSKGINAAPQTFSIGLLETTDHDAISMAVQAVMGPTAIDARQELSYGSSIHQPILPSKVVSFPAGYPVSLELVGLSGRHIGTSAAVKLPMQPVIAGPAPVAP